MQKQEANKADLKIAEKESYFKKIVGNSPAIHQIIKIARRVAESVSTVVLTGESGTGKELIAELIHSNSPRSHKKLITVNCGAFQNTLLESEFFGHVKGAFTGAHREKQGIFEKANGGTIFLDEVSEMSPDMQVKLLRVVEYGTFQKVGSSNPTRTDVRMVVASSRTLEMAVQEGTFREDLYYRLNVITIHLPPLRERKEDIFLLANHFLDKYSKKINKEDLKFSSEALDYLRNYNWPGNVRELQNAIERAVAMNNGNREILSKDFDLKGPLSVSDEQNIEKEPDKVSEQSALSQVLCVLESVIRDQRQIILDMANNGTKDVSLLRQDLTEAKEEIAFLHKRIGRKKRAEKKRPTNEELLAMIKKGRTYDDIGNELNVHSTTVGSWVRNIEKKIIK